MYDGWIPKRVGVVLMTKATDFLSDLNNEIKNRFKQEKTILGFSGFLDRVKENPHLMTRHAGQYLKDTFDYFGKTVIDDHGEKITRFNLFDQGTEKGVAIVGCEQVQEEIYKVICNFAQRGYSDKLIMLHGPNGSAKTSIVESITYAMHRYSKTEEGAVYRFNWIFPSNKDSMPKAAGEAGAIGLDRNRDAKPLISDVTYAFLDESKIASKLYSEYKENPIFLIPMPYRETLLREWFAEKTGKAPAEVELPPHLLLSGLSKRNQLIFDQLLKSYDGDLNLTLRHVQVERFTFSRQYRVGIGTVEPQMSIDAYEKQLTMDKNIANLPTILHNISFHEAMGPLVEANRGILEFSDLLKRPLETFKYLLSTVEKGGINLPTSTTMIDTVYFATSNEKHLDAFKTMPDFASFRGRFELITVPYLLKMSQEQQIYRKDVKIIQKSKKVAPHSLELLCLWTCLTRLREPNTDVFDDKYRILLGRLDPLSKLRIYDNLPLDDQFVHEEKVLLFEQRHNLLNESRNTVFYEGRYGASPREITALLYRAAQDPRQATITPVTIFKELERLIKDRTVFEFLQIEPRGHFHAYDEFIRIIQNEFSRTFENEVAQSMDLVDDEQYHSLLKRYIDHVVAFVKKEKVLNAITGKTEDPSESLMLDIEKILEAPSDRLSYRESLLRKIAAFSLENPSKTIQIAEVFTELLDKLRKHYYKEREKLVKRNYLNMLAVAAETDANLSEGERKLARTTFDKLESRFNYDHESAIECLRFITSYKYNLGENHH
jgi:predicted Ser/Thr protein kinase